MLSRIVRNAVYIVCLVGAYVAFHILHKIVAEELYDRLLAEDMPEPLLDPPKSQPKRMQWGNPDWEAGWEAGVKAGQENARLGV